jgi:hypothetical protein
MVFPHPATVFDLALVQLTMGEYVQIRFAYREELSGLIYEYLHTDNVKVTSYKNQYKRAIQEAFYPAFELGIKDGGGEPPAQGADLEWINAKAEAEWGFADSLFSALKELKALAKEEGEQVLDGVPDQRADGYARTLDGIYSEGKTRGAANKMLTFGGEDGAESCKTCQKLKGKRHRASWWIKKGLMPGQPGNGNYECGGYQCQHYLFDDFGNIYSV